MGKHQPCAAVRSSPGDRGATVGAVHVPAIPPGGALPLPLLTWRRIEGPRASDCMSRGALAPMLWRPERGSVGTVGAFGAPDRAGVRWGAVSTSSNSGAVL